MKMIFGGIYRKKYGRIYNDQQYGFYVPVAYKDKDDNIKYRMVDTYMIPNPCWGKINMEKRIWFLEQANCGETSWKIFFGPDNYYYKNYENIGSDELNEETWELVADLHDFTSISDEDARDYNEKDLTPLIPLWNEDSFRWNNGASGKRYVRKSAKKDGVNAYWHILGNQRSLFKSKWELNDFEEGLKNILNHMSLPYGFKKKVKNELKKIKKYRQLAKEYDEFCEKLNKKKENRSKGKI